MGISLKTIDTALIKNEINETFEFLSLLFIIFLILSKSVISHSSNCVTWGISVHDLCNLLPVVFLILFKSIFSQKPHLDAELKISSVLSWLELWSVITEFKIFCLLFLTSSKVILPFLPVPIICDKSQLSSLANFLTDGLV